MKILVPIKRVFDPYAKVTVAADGLSLEALGAKFEINPFDEIAMEAAVQIREATGSVEIIAVSAAEAIFDDGYDSILSLLLDGCTGVEKYTDEELVAEYLEEFACQEDEVK